MGPQHHVDFTKKTKGPIPRKLLNRGTGRPDSYDPSGHAGQESYRRISQLSSIAVDNKDKFSTTQLSIPH